MFVSAVQLSRQFHCRFSWGSDNAERLHAFESNERFLKVAIKVVLSARSRHRDFQCAIRMQFARRTFGPMVIPKIFILRSLFRDCCS